MSVFLRHEALRAAITGVTNPAGVIEVQVDEAELEAARQAVEEGPVAARA